MAKARDLGCRWMGTLPLLLPNRRVLQRCLLFEIIRAPTVLQALVKSEGDPKRHGLIGHDFSNLRNHALQ